MARSSGVLHTRTRISQYSWVSSVIGTYHSYCTTWSCGQFSTISTPGSTTEVR
ncbi:hypothetical protein D3C86_1691810 [compost metagenome]